MRGRFAPSPTGPLHLGGAATAAFAWAEARAARGALVLRVEDLDPPRVVAGAEADILDDLAWLGFTFDEGPREGGAHAPYRQSERGARYEAAIARLVEAGHAYLCDCSRADIARVASAPHEGEEGPRYPGTCREAGLRGRAFRRAPAVRLAAPRTGDVAWIDGRLGPRACPATEVDDFVLRRGDGVFAYQLAVVVDDLDMGITHVMRGADLAPSAPRQALLASLLGHAAPAFTHVPLLVGPGGERLAKRHGGATVREQRVREPGWLLARIARAYGQPADERDALGALLEGFDPARFPERVSLSDVVDA